MSDAPRIGIVGCGGMGRLHAGNVGDVGGEVVAGADVAPEPRESFAAEFDAETHEDHAAMYDAADPDGVIVTTPNAVHAPATIDALERGIDVLCEKPLADTLEAAERMVAAEAASDAFGMVGFQMRFSPAARAFKAYQSAGRFGDLTHVEGHMIRRRGIPGVGSWFTDPDLSGGGAVIDIGVHLIDFALFLLDYPDATEVAATTRSEFGGRDDYADPDGWGGHWETDGATFGVEDSASAFVRTAGGTTLSLEVAWATNRPGSNSVIVRGTEAGAELDDGLTIYETGTGGADHYLDTEVGTPEEADGQRRKVELFVDGVASGAAPGINTFEQALRTQRVIDGIYRSSERGAAVSPE